MIEIILLNYLKPLIEEEIYMEVPEDAPSRYVLLEKTGGGENNHVKTATVAIQSIAESMYKAAKLNDEIKKVMEQMGSIDEVGKVRLNSDYNFTDTQTKQYRYQAVYNITYY